MFPILNPPPSSLPVHPSGSSQCTSPKHPASYIEPGLAIHLTYDNIHVSMPFSQTIPPSPSPTGSKRLFYTSVSNFFLFFFFRSDHMVSLVQHCSRDFPIAMDILCFCSPVWWPLSQVATGHLKCGWGD